MTAPAANMTPDRPTTRKARVEILDQFPSPGQVSGVPATRDRDRQGLGRVTAPALSRRVHVALVGRTEFNLHTTAAEVVVAAESGARRSPIT